jgi:hypothetical protein
MSADLTVTKVPPEGQRTYDTLYKMPDLKGLPDSYALGSCGMPGYKKTFKDFTRNIFRKYFFKELQHILV